MVIISPRKLCCSVNWPWSLVLQSGYEPPNNQKRVTLLQWCHMSSLQLSCTVCGQTSILAGSVTVSKYPFWLAQWLYPNIHSGWLSVTVSKAGLLSAGCDRPHAPPVLDLLEDIAAPPLLSLILFHFLHLFIHTRNVKTRGNRGKMCRNQLAVHSKAWF